MRIQQARRESTNDISADLKCLMDRRRLMDRAGDRLEILRVESERGEIPIPTDRIERMMRQRHARQSRSIFYENIDVFLLIDCNYFARTMKVALRVRRSHFDLPLVIQITLGNPNR